MESDETLSHDQLNTAPTEFSQLRIDRRRKGAIRLFKAEASPIRVLEVLRAMHHGSYKPSPEDRNSLYVLSGLRLIASAAKPALLERSRIGGEELWLAGKVISEPTIRITREVLRNNSSASALDVGEAISKIAENKLSEASKRRYGGGLLVWVNWIHELISRAK